MKLSLDSLEYKPEKIITMLHYPPFNSDLSPNEFVDMMKEYEVDICIYGHLHSEGHRYSVEGMVEGIEFHLIASDFIDFTPKKYYNFKKHHMGDDNLKELEVKILNIDLEEMENKLKELGAELIAKESQVNTLIDSGENYIENKLNSYLRIRESKSALKGTSKLTLTMKESIDREGVRENLETNIDISDREEMIYLLDKLGYQVKDIGKKERTSYLLKGVRFDLDRWDKKTYPDPYMEIEVNNEDELENMIQILEIDKKNISTKSILELRKEKNLL